MKRFIILVLSITFLLVGMVNAASNNNIRSGVILYKIKDNINASQLKSLNALQRSNVLSEEIIPNLDIRIAKLNSVGKELAISKLFMASGAVKFSEPDRIVSPTIIPNDPEISNQWHHVTIGSPDAWDTITSGGSVNVCVLDTGVQRDHPDLEANLILPGYNANGLSNVEDAYGHGTGTAGVIGAVGDNGVGVAGVLWSVNIIPVQINISDTQSSAYLSTMAKGIEWCANRYDPNDPNKPYKDVVKVVNISYGGAYSSTIDVAATYLRSKGGLLFMSAGNGGSFNNTATFPDWDSFIIVGSTGQNDVKSSFSEYGPFVDLVAPGESIRTTYPPGTYTYYSGTSFSSPMTAGLGAMIFALSESFTPDIVENILSYSAHDLGAAGNDDVYGFGRIDAAKAVSLADEYMGPVVTPVAVAESVFINNYLPLTVSFDGSKSTDDGTIVSYEWVFGDGNVATGKEVEHTYDTEGVYTPTLTVMDIQGNEDTAYILDDQGVIQSIVVELDPSIIVPPSDLTVSSIDANKVTLTWKDNSINETGFELERAKKVRGKFNYAPIFSIISVNPVETTDLSYADIVEETGDYKYRIIAYNNTTFPVKYSLNYSNEVSVKVESISSPPPEPDPDALIDPVLSYSINQNNVILMWNSCGDGNNCTYKIEKGTQKVRGQIIDFEPIEGSPVSGLVTEDSGLSNDTYYYRVKAMTGGKESNFSNVISVRIK